MQKAGAQSPVRTRLADLLNAVCPYHKTYARAVFRKALWTPLSSLPYRLLLEINQPGDDQASLVYAVEMDNANPRTFQLLDLVGFPKREDDETSGEEAWSLYYIDDSFSSALDLVDSGLLTIKRRRSLGVR